MQQDSNPKSLGLESHALPPCHWDNLFIVIKEHKLKNGHNYLIVYIYNKLYKKNYVTNVIIAEEVEKLFLTFE